MVDKRKEGEYFHEENNRYDGIANTITGKTSPFVYNKEMIYTMHKSKESSLESIRAMCRNGMLTELHYSILRALYMYTYLNAYLIREVLMSDKNIAFEVSPTTGRKAIKTLVGRGLLLQYTFKHIDDKGNEQGSPYIYKLSASGERMVQREQGAFLKFLFPRKQSVDNSPFEIISVLKRLTINQFHIIFMNQYKDRKCLQSTDYYKVEYMGLIFPAIYRIELPSVKATLSMFLISIRSNFGWQNEFLKDLRAMKDFIDEKGITGVGILVICETEYQAMEAARYKACDSTVKALEVFYICDYIIVSSDDVLSQLIEVLPKDNFTTRRIFSLSFESDSNKEDKTIIDNLDKIKEQIEISVENKVTHEEDSHTSDKESNAKSTNTEVKLSEIREESIGELWEDEIDKLIG